MRSQTMGRILFKMALLDDKYKIRLSISSITSVALVIIGALTLAGTLPGVGVAGAASMVGVGALIAVSIGGYYAYASRTLSRDEEHILILDACLGNLEPIKTALSKKRASSGAFLNVVLHHAAKEGHLPIVQFILSEGRTVPSWELGEAVIAASENGHLSIIQFILSEGRTIPQYLKDSAVLNAAAHGHFATVEHLLSHGPIGDLTRDSAITNAAGEQREAIRGILRMARTVTSNSLPYVRNEIRGNRASFRVVISPISDATSHQPDEPAIRLTSFGDLRSNPMQYLKSICKKGGFSKVYYPGVIDLGGVTKQFITVLIESLLEKGVLKVSSTGFPIIKEKKDKLVLEYLGRFYSILVTKNSNKKDPLLTGVVFSSSFFRLVKLVSTEPSPEKLIKSAAIILKEADPALTLCADLILDPTKEKNQQAYADVMGLLPTAALADAKEVLDTYIKAAVVFFKHTSGVLNQKIKSEDPAALCLEIQGEEVSKKALLSALNIDENSQNNAYFNQQVEWVREAINMSNLQWRQKFVKMTTGRTTLTPNSKLIIKRGWREESPLFEFHTCFNSLNLPTQQVSKEHFLETLDSVLSTNADYNVA